jgi:DHA1 family multidrug resistance protein-like MFS transporter
MQQNLADGQKTEEGCPEGDWLPMGGGRRHPLYRLDRGEFVVTFEEPDDSWNPQNWTSWKK